MPFDTRPKKDEPNPNELVEHNAAPPAYSSFTKHLVSAVVVLGCVVTLAS